MSTLTIVLRAILVVLIAALIALYFFGKKAQKKQEEQQAQICLLYTSRTVCKIPIHNSIIVLVDIKIAPVHRVQ